MVAAAAALGTVKPKKVTLADADCADSVHGLDFAKPSKSSVFLRTVLE